MEKFIYFCIGIIGMIILINVTSSIKKTNINNATVDKLVSQQIISGGKNNMRTEMRYLVVTDKGTFIVENNALQLKFNNSDIFFHLKEGKKYNFVVSGFGKTFITDYQNILEYTEL